MRARYASTARSGQVLVIAPFLLVATVAMLALAVDVGRIVVERAVLQNGCDAAALAGASVLLEQRVSGKRETYGRLLAEQEAARLFSANSAEASVTVEFGYKDIYGSFVSAGPGVEATLVRATAQRDVDAPGGKLPMFFAGLLGLNETRVEATGTAEVTGAIRGVLANLSPFAVPVGRIPPVGDTITFYPGDPDAYKEGKGDDRVVPGNWGLLNLDGGRLGTDELVDWILNGTGELTIPEDADYVWVEGTSGFRAALNPVIRGKIGDPIIIVVYDQVVGTGSTAEFRCVGFLSVTITACKLVGKEPYAECRINEIRSLHDLVTGGWNESPNVRKVQLVS